jgi:type I restriction enzyme R subunit
MISFLDEAQVELSLIELLRELGYEYAFGPDIACDGPRPERTSYADVVFDDRLRQAVVRPVVFRLSMNASLRDTSYP